jgi:hypothetical protein
VVYVKNTHVPKEERYFADMDNERPFDEDIVGLSKTDEVIGFSGKVRTIKEGDYIYTWISVMMILFFQRV